MIFEISLADIFMRTLAMLAITGVHGLALAGFARLLGDKGPGYDGRLHAGPFGHLQLLGLVCSIIALWGWIRPMRIDAPELKGGRLGLVACVMLSLVAVVAFGMVLQLLKLPAVSVLPPAYSNQVVAWLNTIGRMSVVFAVINLLPLPPLTGGHILAAISPPLHERVLSRLTIPSLALAAFALLDRGNIVAAALRPLVRALIVI